MSNESAQFKLRLPSDIHAEIVEKAKQNKRSLNAEILARLEATVSMDKEFKSSVGYESLIAEYVRLDFESSQHQYENDLKNPLLEELQALKTELLQAIAERKSN